MTAKIKIDNLLKKYSDSSTLRAGVNAIPYIGGALDVILSSGIQKKSEERFLNFLNELETQLNRIDEDKLNYNYLGSEEFYDLFLQTSNLALRTRLRQKIKAYANILISFAVSEYQNGIKAEDVLNIIEGLTENDIKLIKVVSEYLELENVDKVNSRKVFSSSSFSKLEKEFKEEFILFGLLRLLKNSLIIKEHTQNAPISEQEFQITPLFNIVKEFICK
ncbi:hypothetical protein [Hyunsoonleella ulvae]|uniref:hypothetical protein n=1 Tax=Hyunsoonleella ulvae TaxID=2799948 RepID=UPI001939E2C8|nr:hypothetical protein [Hyunsoonleella ulvae]